MSASPGDRAHRDVAAVPADRRDDGEHDSRVEGRARLQRLGEVAAHGLVNPGSDGPVTGPTLLKVIDGAPHGSVMSAKAR